MVAVAGGQQGFGQGSTQAQNGSGSLEKLGGGGGTLTIATPGGRGRLGALASEGAEMERVLGAVVLEDGRGMGGCQAGLMSLTWSSCKCVRMCMRLVTRAFQLIWGHRSAVWSRPIRAASWHQSLGSRASIIL